MMGVRKAFAPEDVVHKAVECFSGVLNTLRVEGIALCAEPLMSVSVMHWRVWSDETCKRKAGAPGRGQRHKLRAGGTDPMQEDDQGFVGQGLLLSGFDKLRALDPSWGAPSRTRTSAPTRNHSAAQVSLVSGGRH